MRRYSLDDEERIRLQARLRDWTHAGLVSEERRAAIEPDLATTLRRTGLMLRLGSAVFTFICVIAAAILVSVVLELKSDRALAAVTGLASLVTFLAADWLIATFRLYRHGVEEALAICSVAFALISGAIGFSRFFSGASDQPAIATTFGVAAGVCAICYFRFGFQYAAAAAVAFAALVPAPLPGLGAELKHLVAAAICLSLFVVARIFRTRVSSEVYQDDTETVAAAALLGSYLSLNLFLMPDWIWGIEVVRSWFRWGTYVLVWIIPAAALWRSIRDHDRTLLQASLVLALATLITNKPYLGWPRQTWDPMLLGIVLIAAALLVRRWLSAGADGERDGFTATRLHPSEDAAIRLAGLASAAVHMQPGPLVSETPQFGGGRSGGGGAHGSF